MIFLDSQLNVRRFTPAAAHLFNLRPTDTGRPLTELTHCLNIADLVPGLQQVVTTGDPIEQEVSDVSYPRYLPDAAAALPPRRRHPGWRRPHPGEHQTT